MKHWSYVLSGLVIFLALCGGISVFSVKAAPYVLYIVYIGLAYALISLSVIGPREIGTYAIFGKPISEVTSGLWFVPLGIAKIHRDTKNVIQMDLGTMSEKEETTYVSERKKHEEDVTYIRGAQAFRITFASRTSSDILDDDRFDNDPLHDRLTCDPHIVVRFRIRHHPTFLTEIGSINAASIQIEDTARGIFQQEAAKRTPAQALKELEVLSVAIKDAIEDLIGDPRTEETQAQDDGQQSKVPQRHVRPWGIDLINIMVKTLGLPLRVNVSIADNNAEGFKKQQEITRSEGDRQALMNRGQGTANAREVFLKAEAAGLKEKVEALDRPGGELVARTEMLQTSLQNANYSILSGGGDLLSTAAQLKETLLGIDRGHAGATPAKPAPDVKKGKNQKQQHVGKKRPSQKSGEKPATESDEGKPSAFDEASTDDPALAKKPEDNTSEQSGEEKE